jgi:hypothetical protein
MIKLLSEQKKKKKTMMLLSTWPNEFASNAVDFNEEIIRKT